VQLLLNLAPGKTKLFITPLSNDEINSLGFIRLVQLFLITSCLRIVYH